MMIRKYKTHIIFYSRIFGQHDPGKTPWGKPIEEEIYYRVLEKYYNKEIDKRNLITISNTSQAWKHIYPRRMSPLFLEVHTLAFVFVPLTLASLLH
jgi:hypothetical protein